MTTSVGIRTFTGWAVAITLSGPLGAPRVIDRRRLVLLPPEFPSEVYHVAVRMAAAEASRLIDQVVEAAESAAGEALTVLLQGVADDAPACAALIVKRGPPSRPAARARMSHTGCHGAEGELFRYAVLRGAEACGLPLVMLPEGELEGRAHSILGPDVAQNLTALGAAMGPPWTQLEKSAALAAWLALAQS